MKPARIALFLQLCFLAGIAIGATPEQEMQAEAKKLLDTLFTKGFCYKTFRPQGFVGPS
jgi:hypothetical protein